MDAMILNLDTPNHVEKIARYIAGEMDAKEVSDFEATILAHPENELIVNEMKHDWRIIGSSRFNESNTEKAWCDVFNRIEKEGLLPEIEKSRVVSMPRIIGWAASIAVIIALGTLLLYQNTLGQKIIVQSGSESSTLVHTLADGSTVFLRSNTTIEYGKKFSRSSRSISLNGEAFFDIEHNPTMPFYINTPSATIEVLGTSFTVKTSSKKELQVVVATGTVSVLAKTGKQFLLASAGEMITLHNNNLVKETVGDTKHMDWQLDRLEFKDEYLGNIIKAINRGYGSNMELASPEIANRRLTVTFDNNSLPAMVKVISSALELEVIQTQNSIIFTEPNYYENN